MKKLSFLMALVMILSLGTAAMAFEGSLENQAQLSGTVGVSLTLAHFVQVSLPDNVDLGLIDFSDPIGFNRRVGIGSIEITTNDDIQVSMSSRGFQDASGNVNEELKKLVAYYYPGGANAHSFGVGGYKGFKKFAWDSGPENGKIRMNLEARFSSKGAAEEHWYKIRSGEYNDVVTVTIAGA